MTSIALLSHRFGNIGHNFMALGAEAVAREAFGKTVSIEHFEQHHPFAIYPKGSWPRLIDKVPHGRLKWLRMYLGREDVYRRLWAKLPKTDLDLAVACGGPNLVAGASTVPEMRILLQHFVGAFQHRGVPFLDAAVGSGFPLERIPAHLNEQDAAFYRKAASYAKVTSVRESEAQRLYRTIGIETPLIPCIAMGSGRYFSKMREDAAMENSRDGKVVIVNFQAKGSNTDWDQGVDPRAWKSLVRQVIDDLKAMGERVVMLCHSAYELRLAKELAPELPSFFPQTEQEYGRIIARAKVGFVSRIHAGIALAGIGVPSLVVGNDTRIGTTREVGLPSYFTKVIDRDTAVQELRSLITNLDEEQERLVSLREATIQRYVEQFVFCKEKKS